MSSISGKSCCSAVKEQMSTTTAQKQVCCFIVQSLFYLCSHIYIFLLFLLSSITSGQHSCNSKWRDHSSHGNTTQLSMKMRLLKQYQTNMFFVTRSFVIRQSFHSPFFYFCFCGISGNTSYSDLAPVDASQRLPQTETEAAQRQSRDIEEGTLPCDGCQ